MTGDSLGPLRIGLTAAMLDSLCPGGFAHWDWGDEAIPEPAVLLRVGGGLVVALFGDTLRSSGMRVAWTEDSRLKTVDGIGAGSTVRDLRGAYGTLHLVEAECALYATTRGAPGLTFRIAVPRSTPATAGCERVAGFTGRPEALPGEYRVLRVILRAR